MSLNQHFKKLRINNTRSYFGAHSAHSINNERVNELRKSLFPSIKRIPGRKFKYWFIFGMFCNLIGNTKIAEIKRFYKYSSIKPLVSETKKLEHCRENWLLSSRRKTI